MLRMSMGFKILPSRTGLSKRTLEMTGDTRREKYSPRRQMVRHLTVDHTSHEPKAVEKEDQARDIIWNVCSENLLFTNLEDSPTVRKSLTDPYRPVSESYFSPRVGRQPSSISNPIDDGATAE